MSCDRATLDRVVRVMTALDAETLAAIRDRHEAAKRWHRVATSHSGWKLCSQSADDVPALLAEVERLRDELSTYRRPGTPTYDQLLSSHASLLDEQDEWRQAIAQTGAEVERLRAEKVDLLRLAAEMLSAAGRRRCTATLLDDAAATRWHQEYRRLST